MKPRRTTPPKAGHAMTRRMTVISCSALRAGTSPSGKEWTLYEVTAVTPEGQPIEQKLKSFDFLSGEVEVDVEKQEHEKHGVSYMLKPVGATGKRSPSPGAQLGPKVDELDDRVEHLETQVKWLIAELQGVRALAQQLATGQPQLAINAGGAAATPARSVPAGTTFGADDGIPF